MVKIWKIFFSTKHHNLHTNRKPWLNYYKICYFRNIYEWFPRKKIPKTVFYKIPKKDIFKNRVFGLKKYEKPIYAYFLIKNLITLVFIYKISLIDIISESIWRIGDIFEKRSQINQFCLFSTILSSDHMKSYDCQK